MTNILQIIIQPSKYAPADRKDGVLYWDLQLQTRFTGSPYTEHNCRVDIETYTGITKTKIQQLLKEKM